MHPKFPVQPPQKPEPDRNQQAVLREAQKILQDPEALQALLQSEQAQALLRRLQNKGTAD